MSEQWVYGLHAVTALLKNPLRSTKLIFINQDRADDRIQTVAQLAESVQVSIEWLSIVAMEKRFGEMAHQGVVALATPMPHYSERDLPFLLDQSQKPALILILDGITDPHNLGACIRTADGAGVDFIIIPKDKNVGITPVVSKVACGAAEGIPVVKVTNLSRAMTILKEQGIWIYGAAGEASTSVYQLDGHLPLGLVLGAEGSGLRRLTRETCDGLFSIPMRGTVTSLNVSVATGVCLYEIIRQRRLSL